MRLSCPRKLLEKRWLNAGWVLLVGRKSKEGLGSILYSLWWLCILCPLYSERAFGSSESWALTASRAWAWNDVLQRQQVVLSLCVREGRKEGFSRAGLHLNLRGRLLSETSSCGKMWDVLADFCSQEVPECRVAMLLYSQLTAVLKWVIYRCKCLSYDFFAVTVLHAVR